MDSLRNSTHKVLVMLYKTEYEEPYSTETGERTESHKYAEVLDNFDDAIHYSSFQRANSSFDPRSVVNDPRSTANGYSTFGIVYGEFILLVNIIPSNSGNSIR